MSTLNLHLRTVQNAYIQTTIDDMNSVTDVALSCYISQSAAPFFVVKGSFLIISFLTNYQLSWDAVVSQIPFKLHNVLVCKHVISTVLVILMLQKLTHIPELLIAWSAAVGIVRDSIVACAMIPIRQPGSFRHVIPHCSFSWREFVNLLPGIILACASSTISALDMLHSICTRTKSGVATDGTRYSLLTMYLHMHI